MKQKIIVLILCSLFVHSVGFSTPLTARQIVDFEIGDIFHYQSNTYTSWNNPIYKIESREILSKQYNLDSSSVAYQVKVISYTSPVLNGNWCNMETDTLTELYEQLDSSYQALYPTFLLTIPCQALDASALIYTEQLNSTYNGRTLYQGKIDEKRYLKCVAGVGIVHHYIATPFPYCSRELVWYKKGNETFGTPVSQFQNPVDPYAMLLKKREVYDFAVGDIFQFLIEKKVQYPLNPQLHDHSIYITEHQILDKIADDTSWTYQIQRKQQWFAYDTVDFYLKQDTFFVQYADLDNWVGQPCQVVVSHATNCDTSILINTTTFGSTGSTSSSAYWKGLGRYNSSHTQMQVDDSYSEYIHYYLKAEENKTCGTFFVFDTLPVITPPPPPAPPVYKAFFTYYSSAERAIIAQFPLDDTKKTLTLFDTQGRTLYSQNIEPTQNEVKIPFLNPVNQLYIVRLTSDKKNTSKKIVIWE